MKRITLWSLYERPRNTNKRWTRVSQSAYTKTVAITVFQDRLLASALHLDNCPNMELRLRRVV